MLFLLLEFNNIASANQMKSHRRQWSLLRPLTMLEALVLLPFVPPFYNLPLFNNSQIKSQAYLSTTPRSIFGSLAINSLLQNFYNLVVGALGCLSSLALDPLALRRLLSQVLPFRIIYYYVVLKLLGTPL